MKGLLLKDFYTLLKQAKIFLLFIVIFAVMPGFSLSASAIFYAAMLPVTALAYDERAKWEVLAAMMPYPARSMVLSKYLLGYVAIAVAAVGSYIVQSVIAAIQHAPLAPEFLIVILVMTCLVTVFLSISFPFMFKFGVEKGRIAFFIIIALGVVLVMYAGDALIARFGTGEELPEALPLYLILATLLINFASIKISERIYRKKSF